MRQNQLSSSQLSSFYHDLFVDKQVQHFGTIAVPSADRAKTVVDIGGGCGYFSKAIEDAYHVASRVIDADPVSVEAARSLGVAAEVGDALRPAIRADDGIACFNLILHHLVGGSERDTLSMQVRAITAWRDGAFTAYHGYLIRDGVWSRLANGRREVLARDPGTGYPTRVRMTGSDELGRTLDAEGRCLNKLGVPLNPNMLSINCLTEWQFNGTTGYGEDHENWTPAEARNFFRAFLGFASG